MFLRFAINSYESPALSLSAQRVVNARTVKGQQGARTQTPVFRCPGIKDFQTLPAPIRGANLVGSREVDETIAPVHFRSLVNTIRLCHFPVLPRHYFVANRPLTPR